MHTSTGEWQTHTLPDGSRITLEGASAVDLHFDAQQRLVELRQGAILVDVATDAARPFVVESRGSRMRALGTRFVVERNSEVTQLTLLESSVAVQHGAEPSATSIHAGQSVRITPEALGPIENIDVRSVADAWKFRQLVVRNRPLAEVLDQLARQRPGCIHYDRAQIEHIRVSAVLPLDDTDRALQLLQASFPQLRLRRFTSYVVLVDAPLVQ